MLRFSFLAASAALLCSAASAQQTLQAKPVLGAARDAGTFHVATQTWTRNGGQSNISPDYIYRNDAGSGYFGTGFDGCKFVDEIILPGTTNPNGGPQDAYLVDGFNFLYCKNGAGTVDWQFCFYDSYVPCDDPCSPANCICQLPTTFTFTGLPGGSACWIFTVDLAGGYELCVDADGGICAPGYDGGGLGLDGAGIGASWSTSDGGTTGPFLNGDPDWKPTGDGTCYNPTFGNVCGASDATGLGAEDLFGICDGGLAACALSPGCYFFGGYVNTNGCGLGSQTPFASFGYGLFADCTQTCTKGDDRVTEYCDEGQNPNNAANISITGNELSQGPINVDLSNAPANQFGYLLIGGNNQTVSQPPGAKGDLCVVGGFLGRYDKDVVVIDGAGGGTTDIENSASGGPGYGIPNGGGNIAAGDTWYFQYWHRQPMGQPATFSSAICVDFKF